VKSVPFRWARPIALLAAMAVVSSCGLPQVGPNKRQIFAGSVQKEGDAFVVAVNDRVTRATAVAPALGFSPGFINAGQLGSDTINPGDTLGLTIWENVDDGLLAAQGAEVEMLGTPPREFNHSRGAELSPEQRQMLATAIHRFYGSGGRREAA